MIFWLFGLVLVMLLVGGGLLFSGLLSIPLTKPSPATAMMTSTPSVLTETPTQVTDSAAPTQPASEPTPTPSLTPTYTPVPPLTATPNTTPPPDPLAQCADAPQQGLQVDDQVYVCTQVDRLTLREAPRRNSDEVLLMDPGTALTIVDGPACADAWLWWQVKTTDGEIGWVAEGGDETDPYFICKVRPCEEVIGPFAEVWATMRQSLGCKTGEPFAGLVAEEHFEGGIMFWREAFDDERAMVLFGDGTWSYYSHTPFVEGSPEFSCVDANTPAQCPPTPKRGFGMMWCDIPELRNRLGNAIDCERGYQATMQTFAEGFILKNDLGSIYILFSDNTWRVIR